MSYDIYLREGDTIVQVPLHCEGGTYVLGGTAEAHLNLTYNYSPHYYKHIDPEKGLRWLYGRTGAETIERLESAIAALGTDRWEGPYFVPSMEATISGAWDTWREKYDLPYDFPMIALNGINYLPELVSAISSRVVYDTGGYWAPTEGNAGYALSILLGWARMHPDAVWSGD